MSKKKKCNWRNDYWLLITFLCTAIGFYFFVFQHIENVLGVVVSILMLFSFPLYLDWTYIHSRRGIVGFLILSGIVLGGMKLRTSYEKDSLEKYPTTVYGKVIGFDTPKEKNETIHHYAIFEYKYENKTYQNTISNDSDFPSVQPYHLGDTLQLTISIHDPEIFRIEGKK